MLSSRCLTLPVAESRSDRGVAQDPFEKKLRPRFAIELPAQSGSGWRELARRDRRWQMDD
jgi:hypothetical protein